MAHLSLGAAKSERQISMDFRHGGGESRHSRAYQHRGALAAENGPYQLGWRLGSRRVNEKRANRVAAGVCPFYGLRTEQGENPVRH